MNCKRMTGLRWENKTNHIIGRLNETGELVDELPASRYAIRVNQTFRPLIRADGTVIGTFQGPAQFKNMPDPIREDTIYVVSGITAQLLKRWNFVAPRSDSAGLDRDALGSIRATRMFVTYASEVPE